MRLPKVLSISGFDPSAGAGMLSDIKTFQTHQVYGFGVVTGVTFQNESHIRDVRWMSRYELISQLDVLFGIHSITAVKIGVTKNAEMLRWIVEYLRTTRQNLIIVWDPVFESSSGFAFWKSFDKNTVHMIVDLIDLITPNLEEYTKIWGVVDGRRDYKTAVLLKTVEEGDVTVLDKLFYRNELYTLKTRKYKGYNKHGTGCILSAGITAGLAKGMELVQAYHNAKNTLNGFMLSSRSLLGTYQQQVEQ